MKLKCVTITTITKVTKVRAKRKTIGTADVNATATLPGQCCLSDKLSILFKSRHARRIRSHFQKRTACGAYNKKSKNRV